MKTNLNMIYWKGEKFWVGKLIEHPEIMTQGKTLQELEENMKDAYIVTVSGLRYCIIMLKFRGHHT